VAVTPQQPQQPAQAQPAQAQPTQAQPTQAQPPKGQKGPPVTPGSLTFNTVITKLKEGKQIFSNTVTNPDLEAAKKACVGQAFIWIEMQHSTLTWRETQQLIKAIAEAGCIRLVPWRHSSSAASCKPAMPAHWGSSSRWSIRLSRPTMRSCSPNTRLVIATTRIPSPAVVAAPAPTRPPRSGARDMPPTPTTTS